MKKKTKKIISIIGILVLIVLVGYVIEKYGKPGAVAYTASSDFQGDSAELLYKTWNFKLGEGICKINICNKIEYPYSGGVCNENYGYNVIPFYNKFYLDNVGNIMYESNLTAPKMYSLYLNYLSGYCPNMLVYDTPSSAAINIPVTKVIDSCYNFGTVDPSLFNNKDETKCDRYCIPDKSVCVVRSADGLFESQKCSSDGLRIVHNLCILDCQEGLCIGESYPFSPVDIQIVSLDDGIYGSDLVIPIKLLFNKLPYANTAVTGVLSSKGVKVSETTGYTNTNGEANLVFKKLTTEGGMSLVISSKVKGVYRNISSSVYINPALPLIITIEPQKTNYKLNEDMGGTVRVVSGDMPLDGILVDIKLVNNQGATVQQMTGTTNSYGEVQINFKSVNYVGDAKLTATATYIGRTATSESSTIIFEGNPFVTTISSKSLVQYQTFPVNFIVNVQDTYGKFMSPDIIKNVRLSATLSNGQITNNIITYKGNGDYDVSVTVNGEGNFIGKIMFDYNNQAFSTEPITLEIRKDAVNIGTSSIDPTATRDTPKTMRLTMSSSSGRTIDVDNILVEVTHPSGIAKDTITFTQFTRINNGTYDFTYNNFKEVEKYTFNVYADKSGYSKGASLFSVSVGGKSGETTGMAGSPIIGWVVSNWYWVAGIIIVGIGGIIYYKKRKKKYEK